MSLLYCSHNGQIIPKEKAVMPISHIEMCYGFGVYENVKVVKGITFFADEHAGRLMHSAKIIGLNHPYSASQIIGFIDELKKHLDEDSYNLKILLIGAKNTTDVNLFLLPLAPKYIDKRLYKQGAKAVTYKYERYLPQAKTLNMLGSYLAYRQAREEDAYDALLVDSKGHILEGTRTNFYCLSGKTIYSPPEKEILEGVTRMAVLYTAEMNGFKLEETDISPSNLGDFEGAFLTSTSTKILPLIQIDNFKYPGICSQLTDLIGLFKEFLNECRGVFPGKR